MKNYKNNKFFSEIKIKVSIKIFLFLYLNIVKTDILYFSYFLIYLILKIINLHII